MSDDSKSTFLMEASSALISLDANAIDELNESVWGANGPDSYYNSHACVSYTNEKGCDWGWVHDT